MNPNPTMARPMGTLRRGFGWLFLIGFHSLYLAWSGLMALGSPRYRRIWRFQLRYFFDVVKQEWRGGSGAAQ
ncbi:MAG: hypothetical protein GX444_10145 [Myxococcales bacterium]|nr:hypothetical protein [Myxococcales bacterium]